MARWQIKQIQPHSSMVIEAAGVNMQSDGTVVFLNPVNSQREAEIVGLLLPRGFLVTKED